MRAASRLCRISLARLSARTRETSSSPPSLPRPECDCASPEEQTMRTLVLTRMHRLTMEADLTSGAAA